MIQTLRSSVSTARRLQRVAFTLGVAVWLNACATAPAAVEGSSPAPVAVSAPTPDPRIALRPGFLDAGEAIWNLRVLSRTPPVEAFFGVTNSDLAFTGNYAIQGNYNGFMVWDITNRNSPQLTTSFVCPASQSDVSVYRNLLFVSGESLTARVDCGTEGVRDTVSKDRLRGLRIFDISDIRNPRNVGNVQTCRGSHTHSVLVHPADTSNVYVYISGSAPVRSPSELAGCVTATPDKDPNSALFRIEVIKVPLAHPERAAIVSSPRIFTNLKPVVEHAETAEDLAASKREAAEARARGAFTVIAKNGMEYVLSDEFIATTLDSIVAARRGTGSPTARDSTTLRNALPSMTKALLGEDQPPSGPTQCHDITLYPAIGLAGGACEGYGMLIDIRDPVNPVRLSAVSDSNFAYWHSATFNNDGSKVLFTDEWGGGGSPKCRVTDKSEWGANAIFTIGTDREMQFRSYYKLPGAQTPLENCVAHNGSMIPIPGRDIMIQAWYQGGISLFDWTDAANPREIGYFDRGPLHPTRQSFGGSWSVYWYNGAIVSSEIFRGLDILELVPSAFISQNEINAAKLVRFDYLNAQGQQQFTWPAAPAVALAYLDQLERSRGLAAQRITAARQAIARSATASAPDRRNGLTQLATQLEADATAAIDGKKVRMLADALRQLAGTGN